ncbi:MAG: hypothetical protein JSR34_07240 [Proteobacteria bacterium]|nr:hypothetical protein [Pseudomonadota bacterium]
MNARLADSTRTDAEAALFMRDMERRGLKFAMQQCGHAGRARSALGFVQTAFREHAAAHASEAWPMLYWRTLLTHPSMRARLARDPRNPASLLDAAPRATLLLHCVAEVDAELGAHALDVSLEAYRHALARAMNVLGAQGIDSASLRMAPEPSREEARPQRSEPTPIGHIQPQSRADRPATDRASTAPPAWLRPALMGALALLVAIGIGSYLWPELFGFGGGSFHGVRELREHRPADTLSPAAQAIAGGDFDLLIDPHRAAIARDLDLYSWYAATAGAERTPTQPATSLPEDKTPETSAPEADTEGNGGEHAP